MSLPIAVEPSARISTEEKRVALESVLASNAFSRADQLRSFLRFICKMEMEGKGAGISEYLIAVEALGRPEDFSTVEDSSVRVMARSLRQKLEDFYVHERPDAGIHIEIAKGSYQPRFVRANKSNHARDSAANATQKPIREPEPAPVTLRPKYFSGLLFFLAGAAISAVVTVLLVHRMAPAGVSTAVDPILREAWSPIGLRDSNVLIAIGNPLHMIFHPVPVILPSTEREYPAPAESYEYYRRHKPLPPDATLSLHAVNNAVSMGQVLGVVTAAKLLNSMGLSYQVLPEHAAPLPSFRGRNVLLIGNPEDSVAVEALLKGMPLTVDFDAKLREIVVRDRRSHKVYVPKRDDTGYYTEVYGLVTVLPSEGVSDGSRKTMVFSGITSVGSNAAVEFMASPQSLHLLRDRLQAEGYSSFPGTYQVVVRATTTAETLLVSAQYEAHAVLDKPASK